MANGKEEMVRVDPIMKFYIESETKKLADQIKKQHGLKTLKVPFITGSQWLGNKLMGNKANVKYRIRKVYLTEGIVELLWCYMNVTSII